MSGQKKRAKFSEGEKKGLKLKCGKGIYKTLYKNLNL